MIRIAPRGGLALLSAALALPAAAEPPPGAQSCSGCHAGDGPVASLAGRPAGEIEGAMAAFRSGALPATVMDRIARGFTEAEVAAIAAWLAAGGRTAP